MPATFSFCKNTSLHYMQTIFIDIFFCHLLHSQSRCSLVNYFSSPNTIRCAGAVSQSVCHPELMVLCSRLFPQPFLVLSNCLFVPSLLCLLVCFPFTIPDAVSSSVLPIPLSPSDGHSPLLAFRLLLLATDLLSMTNRKWRLVHW